MSYSFDEAKFVIYDKVLHRRVGTAPEETPVIFDEETVEKPWGWIFFYNNERYRQTGDFQCLWVGQGPIFFNRDNGDVRVFGSGSKLDHELYDYEMELSAKNGSWCLWLTADQERKQTIVRLKSAFALTTSNAMRMVPTLPHCLFSGVRRHLDWLARQLTECSISTDITLEESPDVAQSVFTFPEGMINPSLAQAYHKRWDVIS